MSVYRSGHEEASPPDAANLIGNLRHEYVHTAKIRANGSSKVRLGLSWLAARPELGEDPSVGFFG